ncbi:MAG TPA: VOC family protein [Xanthobacteraceae bacterium]|nr:VOC family protein [Xanthobacteraceae bacterium]
MGNPFVHVELGTNDVPKAKSFYQGLFDWKLEDMPMPDTTYTIIKVGEGTGGGMLKWPMPGLPAMWVPYILVSDVKAATAKAKSLGGKIMRDITEVPNMGSFSIIADPTGAIFGMWQAKM